MKRQKSGKLFLKLFLFLGISFNISGLALANVPCSLPFNLTNGTIADATQVMANYNALVACLGNAAAAGNNSDITALLGLTTPLTPGVGGTPVFLGGTSSGTNAQVISSTTPSGFTLTQNYTVIFVAGGTNTGATTLQVGAQVAKNIFKQSTTGPIALTGSEIVAGQIVVAWYDGTQFEMLSVPNLTTYAQLTVADQVVSGGANVTTLNSGTFSGAQTFTVDCGARPLQIIINAGNFTIAAPAIDGSCLILSVNGNTAGTISFSGFSVGSNTGDPLDTTAGHRFTISIWEISGIAGYIIKAMQ